MWWTAILGFLKKAGSWVLLAGSVAVGWWLYRNERAKRLQAEQALRVTTDLLASRVELEKKLAVERERMTVASTTARATEVKAAAVATAEVVAIDKAVVDGTLAANLNAEFADLAPPAPVPPTTH